MKIGFFGTGLMGQPMAQRLLAANLPVIASNRTLAKLAPLKESGAEVSDTPLEAIKASDCLILMLTNGAAIKEVILSENAGQFLANKTVISMATIAPSESREIEQSVRQRGGEYLEAPVLGSIPEAEKGKLLVMVGATEEQFKKWLPLLQNFGSEPRLIGPVGTATSLKLALNQLIASLTAGFALSLSFVQNQGVDTETFMEILRQSSLYAATFDKKLQRMCDRNYAKPNFPTKHLLKDINLFLNQASEIGLNISSLEGVRQVVEKATELGFSDEDYSALFSAINPSGK
jgi:3-hydroxyisobutyrate dehydrogenase